ncbi:GNAT family N-acetyltransferase [Pseudoxanthomonas sp. 10H]|uniref:GNAT family N-acetyltransferase n=1 Tax=Pseudoxanthomonas sp. 10H TaxID=3242729 RepID=UPI0035561212
MSQPPAIHHDLHARRFTLEVDGLEAELVYRLLEGAGHAGPVMVIDHTGVPEAIGGRGLAGQLVQAAFEHARAAGWTVVPACSYARAWVERHPDYADLVAH